MKITNNWISLLNVCGILGILAVSVVFGIRNNEAEQSVAEMHQELLTCKSTDYTLAELINNHTEALLLLNQDISKTKQYAEDYKSLAETIAKEIVYVPEYYETTTVKEVEVEKPVYVNNQWREFESPAVLMSWAREHLANLWIVGDQVADCDDYASRLQLEAYKDGYLLSVQILKNGMLNGKNVSNYLELHMGNLAMIGNEIYFVEPQPEYFRVVFVCYRD